jgi:hypothetical protein
VKPPNGRVSDPDPADLAKLRKVAAIRENPYAALYEQYRLLAAQHGELLPAPRTAADQFDLDIKLVIYTAHCAVALSSAKKLTARKKIARCAQELANTLQALRRDEKGVLVHFLPHARQATFDDFITAIRELADEARLICRVAGRPPGWLMREARHRFVKRLLDATAAAGGNLSLNPRSEGGTLVDAIKLLLPYLPREISKMPSFSTLKRLRNAWVQNRKRKFKKPSI